MQHIVDILISRWKDIIESIEVDGFTKPVESHQCFRMNKYYDKEDTIKWCYKVTFNFPMEGDRGRLGYIYTEKADSGSREWNKKLESTFMKMFYDPENEVMPQIGNDHHTHLHVGETKFYNTKVDYMNNQGYRFIIQFYPEGFLSELRTEKLELIGL
jgi:hypothetical protein